MGRCLCAQRSEKKCYVNSILTKMLHRVNAILIKILLTFCIDLDQEKQFMREHKRQNGQCSPIERQRKVPTYLVSNYIPETQLRNKILLAQNRHVVEQHEITQKYNTCGYNHTIFDKVAKNIPWRKCSHFDKWCRKVVISNAEN